MTTICQKKMDAVKYYVQHSQGSSGGPKNNKYCQNKKGDKTT